MKKLITVSILLIFLAACTPGENEQYIQGTWEFANEFENERSGASHVQQFWRFSNGFFLFSQEIVLGKPMVAEGRYAVLESEGDQLVLELFMIESTFPMADPSQMNVTIDREAGTARINLVLYQRSGD